MCEKSFFSNKNYLIFGGSSGIGLMVGRDLVRNGARVFLIGSDERKLCSIEESFPKSQCATLPADLSKPGTIEGVFSWLSDMRIVLDGMVYSAGISPLCLVADNSQDLMEKVFQVNVFSYIEAVKNFQMPSASKEYSRVVAIASITAKESGYRQTLYGSSKAALIAATKLMAKELYNRKIRINCISPGVTDTPMLDELRKQSDNLDEKIKEKQMLGVIPPKAISEAVLFMLSTGSEYMSGTEWVLDGGAFLK